MKQHYTANGLPKKTMYGQTVKRLPDARIPLECVNCPKIPEGKPKTRFQAVDFDKQTWDMYQFYLRCKAVGTFPDDEAVEQVALVVSQVDKECDQILEAKQRTKELQLLAAMLKNG